MIDLRALLVETIRAPSDAADRLLGLLPGLTRETLWTMVGLAAILNTLAFFFANALTPMPSDVIIPLPGSPGVFLVLQFSALVLSVFALHWTGRMLGGKGNLEDMMISLAWLQCLRALLQVVSVILALVLPGFSLLFVLAANIYSVWILLSFIKQAHRFDSIGMSFMVMLLAGIGILIGLTLITSVIGVTATGLTPNV